MKIYLVGGAVRDELLSLPVKERDFVVVNSSHDEMIAAGYYQKNSNFPVYIHPHTKEEYALARREIKSGKGYKGFTFSTDGVSLEEDLKRRDLTINAIAKDLDTGELIDPYEGKKDLEKKVLTPLSLSFSEDPVRAIRAARFYAGLEFKESKELAFALLEIKNSGELSSGISAYLLTSELRKVSRGKRPSLFFHFLKRHQLLTQLFPEIASLEGVSQSKKHHPEGDAFTHTLLALDLYTQKKLEDFTLFLSLLYHDVGKGIKSDPLATSHEKSGTLLFEKLKNKFTLSEKENERISRFISFHRLAYNYKEGHLDEIFQLYSSLRKRHRFEEEITHFYQGALIDHEAKLNSPETFNTTLFEMIREVHFLKGDMSAKKKRLRELITLSSK